VNKPVKRLAAWLGILALVFAQLAVAAYTCPAPQASVALSGQSAPSPCDMVDPDQSNLCDKHCNDSQQSQSAAVSLHAAFSPAFVTVVEMPAVAAASIALDDSALLRATSPPATIRNCCFRI